MIAEQGSEERPVYRPQLKEQEVREMFDDVDQAASFWKNLWESEGTGNIAAAWLNEVRRAIEGCVPEPSNERFSLNKERAKQVISKKRNWSAPGPDRIVNFWWKKIESLHEMVVDCLEQIGQGDYEIPLWFTQGKTSLLPKAGEFRSENHRPITCLNTIYKWFTSCLLEPMDEHLDEYGLMQRDQRGAKQGCSGTIDNLFIDRTVCQDSQRGQRNLSMAWVDVRKAYDSVDHSWLVEMCKLHRLPCWVGRVIGKLCECWNTRICVRTTRGLETSDIIQFRRGLPQGDALCPRLFTVCINPISWMLKATEGYRLSKPIGKVISHLLYIDDLKIFAASKEKLKRVMAKVRVAMRDIGLEWNESKCSVVHVKKGRLSAESESARISNNVSIRCLSDGSHYKFLGAMENTKQDDERSLEIASKVYLQRLSLIWTSPLSDYNKVLASNQFAMPVLSYLMSTQCWPIAELKRLDREARKVIVENGGKHPLGSTALVYLPRKLGGRGLKSIEREYKQTKVKAAIRLYTNDDPAMDAVRRFEESSEERGRRSVVKDVRRYASEFGLSLCLTHPRPLITCIKTNAEVPVKRLGVWMKVAAEKKDLEEMRREGWQGRLMTERWEDEETGDECFSWISEWKTAPTHTISAMQELYQQMLPTKVYHREKTGLQTDSDVLCRLCRKQPETEAHILSGCSALAQTKYLARHNAALKIIFFELLREVELVDTVPPWYSSAEPKALYENEKAKAYWDVPLYAESTEVRCNRIDARLVYKQEKRVVLLEMSCPWISNRDLKDKEKELKYAPLRYELGKQLPGYIIQQHNIVVDVLGGCSTNVRSCAKQLFGSRGDSVLRRVQKAVISGTLNIARTFKISTR